jgi:hypothetical protein
MKSSGYKVCLAIDGYNRVVQELQEEGSFDNMSSEKPLNMSTGNAWLIC